MEKTKLKGAQTSEEFLRENTPPTNQTNGFVIQKKKKKERDLTVRILLLQVFQKFYVEQNTNGSDFGGITGVRWLKMSAASGTIDSDDDHEQMLHLHQHFWFPTC